MSTYRSARESLEARRQSLESELSDVSARVSELSEARARAEALEKQLRELSEVLDQPERRLPLLESVRVASPCKQSWDDMSGDDRVRHCAHCDKHVYNLSAMPADEAALLLFEKEGKLCVRYFRRADGTIMTSDCPVGVRRKRVRRLALAAIGAGALAAVGGGVLGGVVMGGVETVGELQAVPIMGSAAVSPPPPPAPDGER